MAQSNPLLLMEHISKSFPGVAALVDANLSVLPGEVHALVGQNGAGKSTLIKILTGAYTRGGGSILFDGHPVNFQSTQQAQNHGISTIYQEINLVPLRSVAENIFLGREPRRWGLLNWGQMRADAEMWPAAAETDVLVWRAPRIKNVGIGELTFVPVR